MLKKGCKRTPTVFDNYQCSKRHKAKKYSCLTKSSISHQQKSSAQIAREQEVLGSNCCIDKLAFLHVAIRQIMVK